MSNTVLNESESIQDPSSRPIRVSRPCVQSRFRILAGLIGSAAALAIVMAGWLLAAGNLPAAAFFQAGQADGAVDSVDYRASALLHIAYRTPGMFDRGEKAPGDPNEFEVFRRTQEVLIKAPFVLQAALRSPETAKLEVVKKHEPDTISWLQEAIEVDFPKDGQVLRISMSGRNPAELTALVDSVKDAYLEEVVNAEHNQQVARLNQLERVYHDVQERIRSRRSTLESYRASIENPELATAKERSVMDRYADLRREFTHVQFELMRVQLQLAAHKKTMQSADDSKIPDSVVNTYIDADVLIPRLLDRLAQLQELIARNERIADNDNEAALSKYRANLETTQEALDSRRGELRPQIAKLLFEKSQGDVELAALQLQEQLRALSEQEELLRTELDERSQEAKDLHRYSSELEFINWQIGEDEQVGKKVLAEIETLKVNLQAPPRVRVLQAAFVSKSTGMVTPKHRSRE